jgi:hypothetical protein
MKRAGYITFLAILTLLLVNPVVSAQVSVGVSVGTPEFGISVGFAPPEIPDYDQPPCPEDGALWVPGYWAWDDEEADYYWVPGTWVTPPQTGLLWTPGYWSWDDDAGAYMFHDGYWAPEVGFYGGINYGFGYYGEGFGGGRWDNDRFMYNTAVLNVNQTVIRNVYVDRSVVVNNAGAARVSFNGGQGGTTARPTARDQQVAQVRHIPPAATQMQNRQAARTNPQLRASTNHGRPVVAATARPGDFTSHAVAAKSAGGGGWHPPANPHEAAKAHYARPTGNSGQPSQTARPAETAHPLQNPNSEQTARPGENRPSPRESGADNRPNESPRPQQNARPEENRRPEARPENNPPKQQAQPEQRPGERSKPEQKPKAEPKQRDQNPKQKPKEQEPPPHQ